MSETLFTKPDGKKLQERNLFIDFFIDTERNPEIHRDSERKNSNLGTMIKAVVQLNKVRDKARSSNDNLKGKS